MSSSTIPPLAEQDLVTIIAYGLNASSIKSFWGLFCEVDNDKNGFWTNFDLYKSIGEPRDSARAPIIDSLFFMGDSRNQGQWEFKDVLVAISSFCALSKEELLQFFFMILDISRDGSVDREELTRYFDFIPNGSVKKVFPSNNLDAMNRFRGGAWTELEFDGFAQLGKEYTFIIFPVIHTQEMFRSTFLGQAFWERLDERRAEAQLVSKPFKATIPGTTRKAEVRVPGRVTMQELLDFSRRKTAVAAGRRVLAQNSGEDDSSVTKERDSSIACSPILCMIRNSRCMYHVPHAAIHETNLKLLNPEKMKRALSPSGLHHTGSQLSVDDEGATREKGTKIDIRGIPGVKKMAIRPVKITPLDLVRAKSMAGEDDDDDDDDDESQGVSEEDLDEGDEEEDEEEDGEG